MPAGLISLGVRRRALTAAALAVGLALTGCSAFGSSSEVDPPPVPDGFLRFARDGVSFVYPAGWRIGRGPGKAAATVVRISPPGSPPDTEGSGPLVGFGRFEVSSAVEPEESLEAHGVEETVVYRRRLVGEDDVDVPGAAAARRFEFDYESEEDGRPMRKLDLVVVGPDRRTLYNLIAQAPAGKGDELEEVIASSDSTADEPWGIG